MKILSFKDNLQLNWIDVSLFKGEIYGICALWIMVFHIYIVGVGYWGENPVLRVLNEVISRGNMGVDIFLFLSGIFLYFSYSSHEGDLGRFIGRRLQRVLLPVMIIYLPYWIYRLIVMDHLFEFIIKVSTMEFWINGTQTIWFVSMILFCYFIYPYVYAFYFKGKQQGIHRPVILVILVVILTYALRKSEWVVYEQYEIALTRLPVFLIGSYCGKWVEEKRSLKWWMAPVGFMAAIFSVIWFICGFFPNELTVRYFYIFSSLSFLVVFVSLLKIIRVQWIHSGLKFLGSISLECYLAHIMMIRMYKATGFYEKGNILYYFILLIISVVLAWFTERVCQKIRKFL